MIKKLIIMWAFEMVFDFIIEIGEKLAKRTDTEIDDGGVAQLKEYREVFIKFAKGKF
jgi:hypothetical protein